MHDYSIETGSISKPQAMGSGRSFACSVLSDVKLFVAGVCLAVM